MDSDHLTAEVRYTWMPFVLSGTHLTFEQHLTARLERARCSHWGAAVYKWEGPVKAGPHKGKHGILIGETRDLRQRIKQYVSGTQERGNRLWRGTFLEIADARLYVLQLKSFRVSGRQPIDPLSVLKSDNMRVVLEQLLVMKTIAEAGDSTWIVNARQ